VELQQVDAIDAQAFERAADLAARAGVAALSRLGGEEEAVAVAFHPGADAQLGVAVGGGHVDVVHAGGEQLLERAVGLLLAGAPSAAAPKIRRVLMWPLGRRGGSGSRSSSCALGSRYPSLETARHIDDTPSPEAPR